MTFESPFTNTPTLERRHLSHFVLEHIKAYGDKPAFIDGPTGAVTTFKTLHSHINRLASALRKKCGVKKGDVVAILSPNCVEYPVLFHAVLLVGGVVTTLNPAYSETEVLHQMKDSSAKFLVCQNTSFTIALKCKKACRLKKMILLSPLEKEHREYAFAFQDYDALLEKGDECGVPDMDIDPTITRAALPYSSGTTGLSKGVSLSHFNLTANLQQLQAVENFTGKEVFMGVLPFYHIYGMLVIMNFAIRQGITVVVMPKFDFPLFLSCMEKHGVTFVHVVPPVVLALAKSPLVEKYSFPKLQCVFSGAAPLSDDVARLVEKRLNCVVRQGYGMTEMSPISHLTSPVKSSKPSSIGFVIPHTQCRVIDPETGKDVGIDEEGELLVKGPQIMLGYHNNKEATDRTIDKDGWLHTGDIVVVDKDQSFYVVDRRKELIKTKGFQVPPAELEALLLSHPSIDDAAVIGVPDERAGEVPKAFVVLKPNTSIGEEEVKMFVADQVAVYKQLRYVEFVDAIPKSASGKILRRILRDRVKAKL